MPNSEVSMGPIGGALMTAFLAGLFHGTFGVHPMVLILRQMDGAMPQPSAAPFSLGEYAAMLQVVVLGFILIAGLTALAFGKLPGILAFVAAYFSGLIVISNAEFGAMLLLAAALLGMIATLMSGGGRGASPAFAY